MAIKMKFKGVGFISRTSDTLSSQKKYADLAPIENADPDGCYTEALNYAVSNDRVRNIAITGPYGSGKSSVIKTFQKNSKYKFLTLSLATFNEIKSKSGEKEISNLDIEKSILQQMLYGADAEKLPYSRFPRISKPRYPYITSIAFVIWALVLAFAHKYYSYLLTFEFPEASYFLTLVVVAVALSVPIIFIADAYRALYRVSIKKVSLSRGEFETGDVSEGSFLNRHLEEIIYFFESTKYDVVVIEDLDRFESPEIFIKLREINKLINDSRCSKCNVKFLYALKDGIFTHKERTKFFDFIIPVVPVVNSSNALDKLLDRLSADVLKDSIDNQFVREVSLYLDDLRLIHNIFNELQIYHATLGSRNINATKLLAMMIYKNVFPRDFERLQLGSGALYEACLKRESLIRLERAAINERISALQNEILLRESENLASVEELIKVFIAHIVISGKKSCNGIIIGGRVYAFSEILNWDLFFTLSEQGSIELSNSETGGSYRLGKSFSQIQSEVFQGGTIQERKKVIESRAFEKIKESQEKIRSLEMERHFLAQVPLSFLLERNRNLIEECGASADIGKHQLFDYLLRNGYIDENYQLYISVFHEGRLTRSDRDFLLCIRDFKAPDPSQVLDVPEEVLRNMREEDFGQKYALNVTLIDYLLCNPQEHSSRLEAALRYLSQNFASSKTFIAAYWSQGKDISSFTRSLSRVWPRYAISVLEDAVAFDHIALVLSNCDAEWIVNEMNIDGGVTHYLSTCAHLVFSSTYFNLSDLNVLKDLKVKISDVSLLDELQSQSLYVYEHNLYVLNLRNVEHLMVSRLNDKYRNYVKACNYTTISFPQFERLKGYVEENIFDYVQEVLLKLPDSTIESGDSILSLLNREQLDFSTKMAILEKQEHCFEDLAAIPEEFWEHLISVDKVSPSWRNLLTYSSGEHVDAGLLSQKLSQANWLEVLGQSSVSDVASSEERKDLAEFILANNELNMEAYEILVKGLPYRFRTFPDIDLEKKKVLVRFGNIVFGNELLSSTDVEDVLKALLIEFNSSKYFSSKEKYFIDDGVREQLLKGNLPRAGKVQICRDATYEGVVSSPQYAAAIAEVLAPEGVECHELDVRILKLVIQCATKVEFSLRLLKKVIGYWSTSDVMDVIATLHPPYDSIALFGKRPTIVKSDLNLEIVQLLMSKRIISSYSILDDSIRIVTFRAKKN